MTEGPGGERWTCWTSLLATLYGLALVAWALAWVVWDWLGRPWRKG